MERGGIVPGRQKLEIQIIENRFLEFWKSCSEV